jgi:hypothetical protein
MFEELKQGVGEFLGQLTAGAMPSGQRDYGPVREAFQEGQNVDGEQPTVRLVNDYSCPAGPAWRIETGKKAGVEAPFASDIGRAEDLSGTRGTAVGASRRRRFQA